MARRSITTEQLKRWSEFAEDALTPSMPENEWCLLDQLRQELHQAWVDAEREDARGKT